MTDLFDVSRETREKLSEFRLLLLDENGRQNLISKSSEAEVDQRHILDGLQLIRFAPEVATWCDIGSGPGLPGLVIAIATGGPITLIEPRPRRCEFLRRAALELDLPNVTVLQGKAEAEKGSFDCITARAVAKADQLFAITQHLAHEETIWILPKGRTAQLELEEANRTWQGEFRLEPSLTSDDASILVATKVRRRG